MNKRFFMFSFIFPFGTWLNGLTSEFVYVKICTPSSFCDDSKNLQIEQHQKLRYVQKH